MPSSPGQQPPNSDVKVPVSGQSLVGLGTLGLSNAGSIQAGGEEVTAIAAFLNLIAQFIKAPEWFNQNRWIIPILLIIGFGAAYFIFQDYAQAFLKGSLSALQAIVNFNAYKATGLGGFPAASYSEK